MSTIDPTNPNMLAQWEPRTVAKPTASAPLTKLTEGTKRLVRNGTHEEFDDGELEKLVHWMRTHTALCRLGHDEVMAALKRTEAESGFIMVKAAE